MTTSIVSVSTTQSKFQVNNQDSFSFDTSGNINVNTINGGYPGQFRNKVINGDMRVAQRGNIAGVSGVLTYGGPDRHAWSANSASAPGTIQQLTSGSAAAGVSGFASCITGVTMAAASSVYFQHRIESLNSFGLNGKTITVSCKVYQTTGGTITLQPSLVKPPTTADIFTNGPATIVTASSVSIPTSALTTVTFTYTLGSTDASLGLGINLVFITTGAVSAVTFCVTDLQLEIGSVATPFEQRPYSVELAMCQRYYEICQSAGCAIGVANSTTGAYMCFKFQTPKRTTVISIVAPAGTYTIYSFSGGNVGSTTLPVIAVAGVDSSLLTFSGYSATLTGGQAVLYTSGNPTIGFNAEL